MFYGKRKASVPGSLSFVSKGDGLHLLFLIDISGFGQEFCSHAPDQVAFVPIEVYFILASCPWVFPAVWYLVVGEWVGGAGQYVVVVYIWLGFFEEVQGTVNTDSTSSLLYCPW
jgi:hypothetical protein